MESSNKEEEEEKKNLPNLMNDGPKEPQEQDNYSTLSSKKKMIDLQPYGGAYPKFGMKIHRPEGGA